jgi:diguanylate cyclase (GGDEF)-like protein/PAS domain S-box-containing protein
MDDTTQKTIMVVEDEIVIAMDLQATLISMGYNVPEIIISGEEAIEKAQDLKPDLVLMDIHLSDRLDGIDAAEIIARTLDIPVVYLTAYADEQTLQRASFTSPFGYILKPAEARELQANIEIALHKYQLEKTIKENRRWLLAVLNSISEGVAACDIDGLIKFMNPVAEVLTGWSQDEAIGRSPAEIFRFMDEVSRQLLNDPLLGSLQDNAPFPPTENVVLLTEDDTGIPVIRSVAPIYNEQGSPEGAVMVVRDNTDQRRLEAQLAHNALHDSLTQLPNRTLFLDRLQQAMDRSRRSPDFGFVVMLLDLDRFKSINDTFGHLWGDQLLLQVAPRLQAPLRAIDTIARFGGDEFAILIEDTNNVSMACRIAERILAELKLPFVIENQALAVTASIGIVMSSIPYEQAVDLLRNADIAMYRVKARGRGDYELFDEAMQIQAHELMQREHNLRQSIDRNELQVYYQPIVSLATHEVTSLEALVRWQKPDHEMIYPNDFIHLAEEIGMITAIDQWVLQQACLQLQTWQQMNAGTWIWEDGSLMVQPNNSETIPSLSINVNLSSKHFSKRNLVDIFATILQNTGLSGHHLKLEITESVFIENAKDVATMLKELKDLNIQICLDDFGTGYSSFSYLHQFPIDIVKIDRSFVQDLDTAPERLAIVRAIVTLCHTLGMTVTAEGIETTQQRDILRDLGCEYGQGFLFSRAVDGAILTKSLGDSTL